MSDKNGKCFVDKESLLNDYSKDDTRIKFSFT